MAEIKSIVSIFTTRWGHLSIAEGILDSLDENLYETRLNFIPVEKISELSYMPVYKLFPQISKFTFKAAEQNRISDLITKFLHNRYKSKIEKYIRSQKPTVVINTYFGFNYTLEKMAKKYNFLYINFVADPRTFSKLATSDSGYNFVFDEKSKQLCIEFGIPENKIVG